MSPQIFVSFTQERSKNPFTNGMMDSGLGRTLSSYGRPKMRSRSEERMSMTPIMPMMVSVRSEPLSESITKMHSNPRARYVRYHPKEDLLSNLMQRNRAYSQSEQYGAYNDSERPRMVERHKPRKENIAENHSAEGTEKNTKLQVPPLNSNRLEPKRHKTKGAILTILDNGEVCIEFIKRRNGMVCKESINKNIVLVYEKNSTKKYSAFFIS